MGKHRKSTKSGSSKHGTSDNPLDGLKASVILERGGACVRIDDVPAPHAFDVLAELLGAMRVAAQHCPELTTELTPVAGYAPLDVRDDDYADEGRHVAGFHARLSRP
jgi:hypothetical protein